MKLLLRGLALPLLLLGFCTTAAAEEWKNWFDDPFFQVRKNISGCPVPQGPTLPESRRNAEAHYRVERGTSCWLAGKCDRANAYWYDKDIGKAVEKVFADTPDFADTSLWVTVQRRFVMVEGCVGSTEAEQRLASLLQAIPDVERVIVQVRKADDTKPPYAIMPDAANQGN
jgi:hypothetical protein